MRSDAGADAADEVREQRTFIETARRAQIVAAAIDTIAEVGYGQASMARIAERVGISKGVIAYHFDGKQDLVKELVAEVLSRAQAYMVPRIAEESSGPGVLRAYIESNLAFMGEYRNHLIALVEIARGARSRDGARQFNAAALAAGAVALGELLERFQRAGELRIDFDPQVMALAIRAAIDAVPPRLAQDPTLDVGHYGRELADLFDLATRNETTRSRKRRP